MAGIRRRELVWALLAALSIALAFGVVLDAVWRVAFAGEWSRLVVLPVAILFYWWCGVGAWRRTSWGRSAARRRADVAR